MHTCTSFWLVGVLAFLYMTWDGTCYRSNLKMTCILDFWACALKVGPIRCMLPHLHAPSRHRAMCNVHTSRLLRTTMVCSGSSKDHLLVLPIPTHLDAHAQGVVHEEIFHNYHNKTQKEEGIDTVPQQLLDWLDQQILEPSASYFHETFEQHLSGLKPNASSIDEVVPSQSTLFASFPIIYRIA